MKLDRPIFVIGHPRSGTTMFRLALTAHSEICVPPESPFFVQLFQRFGKIIRFGQKELQDFAAALDSPCDLELRWEFSLDQFRNDLSTFEGVGYAELCANLYQYYAQQKDAAANFWGDKNNPYHRYVDLIATVYPHARFLHLIRDGRAVFASYVELSKSKDRSDNFPQLHLCPIQAAAYWSSAVCGIEQSLQRHAPDRSLTIRYENVVQDFEASMTTVCDFLGLNYESQMVEFDELNRAKDLEPRAYDAWKWRTREKLTNSRVAAWRDTLSAIEQSSFESLAGRALTQFGYEKTGSAYTSLSARARYIQCCTKLRMQEIVRKSRYKSGKPLAWFNTTTREEVAQ